MTNTAGMTTGSSTSKAAPPRPLSFRSRGAGYLPCDSPRCAAGERGGAGRRHRRFLTTVRRPKTPRVSYPINHIENIVKPISKAGHATKVIFLTADAFGVLPPVSRLTADQTQYHFLSGFTAKLAGTERVTEPTPTFSACFGAAFLSLHPTQYAEVLVKRMQASGAQAYLVNTGWNGTGKRISIKDTAPLSTPFLMVRWTTPKPSLCRCLSCRSTELPGVDTHILDPRNTYGSPEQWQEKAEQLAKLFIENFEKYTDTPAGAALVAAGPKR